jgi:hypothetical protein
MPSYSLYPYLARIRRIVIFARRRAGTDEEEPRARDNEREDMFADTLATGVKKF